ncbi:hypothetical protein SKAU_G00146960 [Synaphobranchus kaupii]|uniref:Protein FAM161A n=1 Tax=Synaphobranchus kaupii TaxID=118154 RepID=A0A9Q1FUB1_SYNKA|nr:hypothetical protein SKAU_G00146960 [Synaphobranchus kaupii]
MQSSHRTNVLVTSCLKTPVDPHTKVPLALYERERSLPYAAGHAPDNRNCEKEMEYDSDSEGSDRGGRGDHGGPALIKDYRVSGEDSDLRELCCSNAEYYRKLEELRRAHLQTAARLEGMFRNKLEIKAFWPTESSAEGMCRSKLEKSGAMPVSNLRKAFSAVELNQSRGGGLSDTSEEDGADDDDVAVEKGLLSSPNERIRTMWQNFTVGDLSPRDRPTSCSSLRSQAAGRGRGGDRAGKEGGPEQDTWRHRVTVPEPFQMTLREADRKRRNVKSRSEVELENALLRKQMAETSECRRKFRASPVPAHIYLPLYEEIAGRDRERRQLSRQRDRHFSPDSQKPFSFLERDRRKKEEREAEIRHLPPAEEQRAFRAKPVPRSVYDSTVSEQMKEDQLYRAIKMQMRAQELLHSSSLPQGMLVRRPSARHREPAERTEADFRPKINGEVPDFDASYRRFRKHALSRRDTKPTTACEPFRLRTAQIASHRDRDRILADMEAEQAGSGGGRWPYVAPAHTPSSSLCSSLSDSQELLPAKITDAAKMRQEAVR